MLKKVNVYDGLIFGHGELYLRKSRVSSEISALFTNRVSFFPGFHIRGQ